MKRISAFCISLLFFFSSFAEPNDLKVVLHENMINKLLTALGNFSGTAEYKMWLFSGTYKWTVINPRIKLKPGKADFICDVKVEVRPFDYQTEVPGDACITYDEKTNLINVKIT